MGYKSRNYDPQSTPAFRAESQSDNSVLLEIFKLLGMPSRMARFCTKSITFWVMGTGTAQTSYKQMQQLMTTLCVRTVTQRNAIRGSGKMIICFAVVSHSLYMRTKWNRTMFLVFEILSSWNARRNRTYFEGKYLNHLLLP